MDKVTFTGRLRKPWYKKINPLWWFGTDEPIESWYHPEWPQWRRYFIWNFIRNPLQNMSKYVIGVEDRNFTAYGRYPVLTVQRDDLMPPQLGWQWCVLLGAEVWVPLPFVSYSGSWIVWYLGWQPTGKFGIKAVP